MPRQPYLQLASPADETTLDIGAGAIGKQPALEKIIGECLISWPHVEAEMALFLGEILGTENAASSAVYQILRRSSAQREAVTEAARAGLSQVDQEITNALLNVHKSIEAERNALAHGHFGLANTIPDGIVWMTSSDYVNIRIFLISRPAAIWNPQNKKTLLSRVWVYREPDLKAILDDIRELAGLWYSAIKYLRLPEGSEGRAQVYRQLCERPHIRRELEKLRRENAPPIQP